MSARRGYAAALAAAVLFGGVNVAAKVALRDADPLAATAITFGASGLLFLPLLVSFRPRRQDVPLLLASATVGGAFAALALYAGLERVAASTASLLLTAEMAFTALLAWLFLRERPPRGELPGLALLVAAALAAAAGSGLGPAALPGVAFVLLATLCWGVDNNLNAVLARRYGLRHLVAARGAVGGAVAALLAFAGGASFDLAPATWALLLGTGLVGLGLSTLVYYAALRDVGATRAVVVFSTSSLWGALAAFALLDEPLGLHHAASFALAAAGFVLVGRAAARARAEAGERRA